MALKRTERPCTFKLDGVIAGFANTEHITNLAQETPQFLRELSVLLGPLVIEARIYRDRNKPEQDFAL